MEIVGNCIVDVRASFETPKPNQSGGRVEIMCIR